MPSLGAGMPPVLKLHVSQMFARYGQQIVPLSNKQLLAVLQAKMGFAFDRKLLRKPYSHRPYFMESCVRRDLYFCRQPRQ